MTKLEMVLWAVDFLITGLGWKFGGPAAAFICFVIVGILIFVAISKINKEANTRWKAWHRYGMGTFAAFVIITLGIILTRWTSEPRPIVSVPQALTQATSPSANSTGASAPVSPHSIQSKPHKKRAVVSGSKVDNSVQVEKGSTIEQKSTGACSPNIVGGSNTVNCPKESSDVGIIGAQESTEVTNSLIDGFKTGIDASPSKTLKSDHNQVIAPHGQPPKQSNNDSMLNIGSGARVEFNQGIIHGALSAKDGAQIIFKNGVIMSEPDMAEARRAQVNLAVMQSVRDRRTDPPRMRLYLAKLRSYLEEFWKPLSHDEAEKNEELFTDFEDSAVAPIFDERKSTELFDKILDATPSTRPQQ